MNDQDLIAAFIAKNGITRVPAGRRSLSEAEMKRAIGWQPEKLNVYTIQMIGEDGAEFWERVSAESAGQAWDKAKQDWPECQIVDVNL